MGGGRVGWLSRAEMEEWREGMDGRPSIGGKKSVDCEPVDVRERMEGTE